MQSALMPGQRTLRRQPGAPLGRRRFRRILPIARTGLRGERFLARGDMDGAARDQRGRGEAISLRGNPPPPPPPPPAHWGGKHIPQPPYLMFEFLRSNEGYAVSDTHSPRRIYT